MTTEKNGDARKSFSRKKRTGQHEQKLPLPDDFHPGLDLENLGEEEELWPLPSDLDPQLEFELNLPGEAAVDLLIDTFGKSGATLSRGKAIAFVNALRRRLVDEWRGKN